MLPLSCMLGWAVLWASVRLLLGLGRATLSQRCADHASIDRELKWWRATVRVHTSVGGLPATLASKHCRALRGWFSVGAAAGLLAAASSVALLVSELGALLHGLLPAGSGAVAAEPMEAGLKLQLALPGITLPLSHAVPLWLALATSMAVHEAGHALAAAAEGVQVTAAGFSLVLLLPAAFVELDRGDLAALGRHSFLRVATAGAWHNAALGVACWAAAFLLARTWWLLAPLQLLLAYAVSFSAALCLLNMAPVHYLDGQQVLEALLLRPRKPKELPGQLRGEQWVPSDGSAVDENAAGGRGSRAAVVRWILHAGTGLYAAVLLLHVLCMR